MRSFVYSPHVTHCIWHRKTTVYSLAIASWNALLGVSTVHSPLFFRKIVGNKQLLLQANVSNVPSLACEYQSYMRWYTIKKCIKNSQMFSKRSKVFLRQQHDSGGHQRSIILTTSPQNYHWPKWKINSCLFGASCKPYFCKSFVSVRFARARHERKKQQQQKNTAKVRFIWSTTQKAF